MSLEPVLCLSSIGHALAMNTNLPSILDLLPTCHVCEVGHQRGRDVEASKHPCPFVGTIARSDRMTVASNSLFNFPVLVGHELETEGFG